MRRQIRCAFHCKILRRFGIEAITLYPWIFFAGTADEISETLFRHELEHIYQVERWGWFQLYLRYLRFYFANRLRGLSHFKAYWEIPFEVEARVAERGGLSDSERELMKSRLKIQKDLVP